MSRKAHRCPGEGCGYCERRIAEAEYERDHAADDYPDYYDGT
ncbi:hypothetical protein I5H06_gp38 [Mycobacterium phage SirPhilip]|uniref:Uncharacterized protein n=1 Tax=Mycobacterium phage SirPhilip TaxID=2015824 RepID=A0A222ZKK1_9CAUD|nr:hypothetical protein I5H06_gp38 [Mycobacterium phage SirPhilip]ASR85266.1 hypothetical protein SEA_SIRPHILIP_64 [Mycobacterium phage SirPhilip]